MQARNLLLFQNTTSREEKMLLKDKVAILTKGGVISAGKENWVLS
jgi:hypothetical protein